MIVRFALSKIWDILPESLIFNDINAVSIVGQFQPLTRVSLWSQGTATVARNI
jgi:hypothetical protein